MRLVAATGRILRALLALAILAGFTAGVPWLLTVFAGWPLGWIGWPHPADVPSLPDLADAIGNPWSDQQIIALLATVGWLLWAQFCRDLIIEGIYACLDAGAARRGARRTRGRVRGPVRMLAALLIGAIIGITASNALRGAAGAPGTPGRAMTGADYAAQTSAVATATAHPSTSIQPSVTLSSEDSVPAARNVARAVSITPASTTITRTTGEDSLPEWARNAPGGVYRVLKGDNLWDIAEAKLGDPYRWREIYLLNRGHLQPNGYALTDPDEIDIGWVLMLPATQQAPEAPSEPEPATPAPANPGSTGTGQQPAPSQPAPSPSATTPASPQPSPTSGSPETSTQAEQPETTPQAADSGGEHRDHDQNDGINLPSRGWISLGLATTIAAVAGLLRLNQRRHARLTFPIPAGTEPAPSPVPAEFAAIEAAGNRQREPREDGGAARPEHLPVAPETPAPVGQTTTGTEISLFDLPGSMIALSGSGATGAARAILAATLATGVAEHLDQRPVVITSATTLARLLPEGVPPVGLDPDGVTFDGERLIIEPTIGDAVTRAEEEMLHRRRLLDYMELDSVAALNAGTNHAERQPPAVLLLDAEPRYAVRLTMVASQRTALHLHPVILGNLPGHPAYELDRDGYTQAGPPGETTVERWSTLNATDLAQIMTMISASAARGEAGLDPDDPPANLETSPDIVPVPAEATPEPGEEIPTCGEATPAVRLRVLGPVTVSTDAGQVTTGMRKRSYAILAVLAAHPAGRTLEQLAALLLPNVAFDAAANQLRTAINVTRRVLRDATGDAEAMYVLHDPATTRYRIDPDAIDVDLWHLLTALQAANTRDNDDECLATLRDAVNWYTGDFATGQDWSSGYTDRYRHQILAAYARIAEILETDHPDQAVTALEQAIDLDPVNEDLYQRLMRVQGRLRRPDAVRRTLRQLEDRLADLGYAE
ncbi:MAG: LysM peptidoglycan-binding domain-containing protein, partial [Micromonosporaceae bacterium]|nr:LysM peptidoglycan-binding domain-containing protein [Micromonosporaceae bacterium]